MLCSCLCKLDFWTIYLLGLTKGRKNLRSVGNCAHTVRQTNVCLLEWKPSWRKESCFPINRYLLSCLGLSLMIMPLPGQSLEQKNTPTSLVCSKLKPPYSCNLIPLMRKTKKVGILSERDMTITPHL